MYVFYIFYSYEIFVALRQVVFGEDERIRRRRRRRKKTKIKQMVGINPLTMVQMFQ